MYNKPTFGFNTPNVGTATPFGQSTGAFGAKPAGTFGTPAFGSNPTGTGGLFGQSNTSTGTGLFGSNQTSTGNNVFGQQSTGFNFGSSTPAASNSTGLFGAQPNTGTGGLFSTPSTNSAFGAKTPGFGGFGATSTPASGTTGIFGQQHNTGGIFGQSSTTGFGQQQTNGTTIKFAPLISMDTMVKNGNTTSIQTKLQCITAMKEYQNKSLEELRVEDYLSNRKGKQPGSTSTGIFGGGGLTTTTTASTGFGGFGGFGASAAASQPGFGGTQTSTQSLFGQPSSQTNSLFGQNKPLFGAATTSTGTTGFGGFGTNTGAGTSLFGQAQNKPTFGAVSTQPSIFGGGTSTGTGFGATSTGFGNTQPTGLFGANRPAFGTATSTGTGFGTGGTTLFGNKPAVTASGGLLGNTSTGFGNTGGFNLGTGNLGNSAQLTKNFNFMFKMGSTNVSASVIKPSIVNDELSALAYLQGLTTPALVGTLQCYYWLVLEQKAHKSSYWLPSVLKLATVLGLHYITALNKDLMTHLSSPVLCKVMLSSICHQIQDVLLNKVRNSHCFSILLDNTVEGSVKSRRVTVLCRCFIGKCDIQTIYLGVLDTRDEHANTMYEALINFLTTLELPLEKIVAFGSDGGTWVINPDHGLGSLLKQNFPNVAVCHSLSLQQNLFFHSGLDKIQNTKKFMLVMQNIFQLLQKKLALNNMEVATLSLPLNVILDLKGNDDRLALSFDFVTAICSNYEAVICFLKREACEGDFQAAGLLLEIQQPYFLCSSATFQDVYLPIQEVAQMLKVYSFYKDLTSKIKQSHKRLTDLVNEGNLNLKDLPGLKYLREQGINFSSKDADLFLQETYVPALKKMAKNFLCLFPDSSVLDCFSIFTPSKEGKGNVSSHLEVLVDFFNLGELDDALEEYEKVLQLMENDFTPYFKLNEIAAERNYPICAKLCMIALVLPSGDIETNTKLVKIRERLDHLHEVDTEEASKILLIAFEGPALDSFDFVSAAKFLQQIQTETHVKQELTIKPTRKKVKNLK